MKSTVVIFSLIFCLVSCVKYEEPTLVSLPGEYIIDKVTVSRINDIILSSDTVYLPGSVYINENEPFPLDSISVGFTKWHFDYSIVSFNPNINSWGQTEWENQYFYHLIPSWTVYDLGYIDVNINGRRLILKILEDTAESITLRATGLWSVENNWEERSFTLHLTRIGP